MSPGSSPKYKILKREFFIEFVSNDEEVNLENFNPDFCENSHFNNALIGVAQIESNNNKISINNFVEIDINFYSFINWSDFIPRLKSSDIYDFLEFDNLPPILLKLFRTIFWNICYKEKHRNNVMTKLTNSNQLLSAQPISQKIGDIDKFERNKNCL
jgi:hypothetical protein